MPPPNPIESLPPPPPTPLCAGYRPPEGVHDEMCTARGDLRDHWTHLVRALERLGARELERREEEARRLIRDNGVTYTVYGDPGGRARAWQLDLVPLLVTSAEWARVETGLIQRAELLSALIADLYGRREVVRRGLLPPELLYSEPGFLRPCDGLAPPGGRPLVFYAADLARGPRGELRVLADRAQVPSGAGYALENRLVLSRVLPSLFRDSQVHRLAAFFRAVRRALGALAPATDEPPRTVVLTPGPHNEAYFEHAYLASYLGYTLVQGADLTVRGERLYLKSLEGLQPIDVVLRRVDDEYCDPLELREDSVLGVPGLVQATRARAVAIANPLGSGVVDSPALMQYLPGLAHHLLGEHLQIASAETWWCGTPAGLSHVLANLERLVIKPARPGRGERSVFGAALARPERDALASAIRARPHRYVGQAVVTLSTAPVLVRGRAEPRHVVLRSFLVGTEDGYAAMPGGLTRAAPREGQLVVSNQVGGIGKDTWVLASEPEQQESLLVGGERRPVRGSGALPSRVADDLFWLGRYAERADGLVRLLRLIADRVADQTVGAGAPGTGCVPHLLRAVTHQSGLYPGFVGGGAEARLVAPEPELLAVITDGGRPGSLSQSLRALLQVARSARDRLSGDTWRVLGEIERNLEQLGASGRQPTEMIDDLEALVTGLAALAGLMAENMSHGPGWRFLELGRRLERVLHTATLMRATVVPVAAPGVEAALLESVLSVTDSLIAYRQRYRTGMRIDALLDLLVYDEDNPRALVFQLARIVELVARLPRERPPHRSREERLALEALSEVRLSDAALLVEVRVGAGLREGLDGLLARLQRLLPRLADAVSATHFRLEEQPHPLSLLATTP
jgi:uncharacterized circularly permuted ATP-grasp superfamily protein/uncharacterized alpha-E superfamily protein